MTGECARRAGEVRALKLITIRRIVSMNRIIVELNISKDKVMEYYKGHAQSVIAHTLEGKTVKFPAQYLRSIVGTEGVMGRFEIQYDDSGKLHSIQKM